MSWVALGSGLTVSACLVSINDYEPSEARSRSGSGGAGAIEGGGGAIEGGGGAIEGGGGAIEGGGGAIEGGARPDGAGTCDLAVPPGPPSSPILVDFHEEFSVAIESLDLGDRPEDCGNDGGVDPGADLNVGLDLDEECRGGDRAYRAGACGGGGHEDGERGIDNQLGKLLHTAQCVRLGLQDYNSARITEDMRRGLYTLLLTVTGYNLSANDDDVGLVLRIGADFPYPRETAEWPIALIDGEAQPYVLTGSAYVRDNVLVANLGDLPLKMPLGDLTITTFLLHDAVLTCHVEGENVTNLKLARCVLGAAWRVEDLLHELGTVQTDTGIRICDDDQLYDGFNALLCGAADLTADPGGICDAVSFAAAFETVPVAVNPSLWKAVGRSSSACEKAAGCARADASVAGAQN